MFTILAILGGIIATLGIGGMLGEVTGAKKTLSNLPMLSLPTIEDVDIEDEIEVDEDETEDEDSDDEEMGEFEL